MEAVELARAARTRVAMVVPPYAFVLAPVADLRATPRDDAELVDQLHYNEMARVLASRDAWHYVQAEDHYLGWIRDDDVQVMPGSQDGRLVGRVLAPIYREPDASSEVVGHLPAGTSLATRQTSAPEGPWVWVNVRSRSEPDGAVRGYVSLDDAVTLGDLPHRPPTVDDLLRTAEAFLGVPYLWGGTSALGIDCSGYVQQVYRLNGVRLDRDADQQAMEGRPVEEARAGDLLFFGEARITHVALATGQGEFLHAPESGGFVERGSVARRTPRVIRRYLPDPA